MPRTKRYVKLFEPGRLGPLTLRNRIVLPAMDQNLCTADGLLTESNFRHYEERAAGGAALLILETSAVAYPEGATSRHQPSLSDDRCIPGVRELAERVHHHGAALLVQICHHGRIAGVDTIEDRPMLVPTAPLPPRNPMGMAEGLTMDEIMKLAARFEGKRPTHRQATTDDLARVVDAFASAAHRVATAGADGVEIHAAHGYLISSFLSPYWNTRTDTYGGSLEGRCRLLREIVAAVRAATSPDFAIVVRLDGKEFGIEGGITPALAAAHAKAAVAAGADAVHVSAIGAPDSGVSFTEGPLPWKPAQYRELTAVVRAAVDAPVIAVGRIRPDDAEAMLTRAEADFVAMGRQLLADPELPRKIRDGTPERVRPCINCFVCVAENFWDGTPVCAVNARLGHYDEPSAGDGIDQQRLVVVGGGPAGMEFARVSARKGHRVTLFEASGVLGGTARFSSLTTPLNGEFIRYLEHELDALGVDVRLGVPGDAATISALDPDAVVVATGARRVRPEVPGADLPHVLTGDDLRALLTGDGGADTQGGLGWTARLALRLARSSRLSRNMPFLVKASRYWMPVGRHVVVIGGGLVGLELAEFLAERDRRVTVLEPGPHFATEMAHPRRWRAVHEARTHGVALVTAAELTRINPAEVHYRVGDTGRTAPADTVVVASGVLADPAVADELREAGLPVHVIGDAAEVGYIQGAIRSANDLAAHL